MCFPRLLVYVDVEHVIDVELAAPFLCQVRVGLSMAEAIITR